MTTDPGTYPAFCCCIFFFQDFKPVYIFWFDLYSPLVAGTALPLSEAVAVTAAFFFIVYFPILRQLMAVWTCLNSQAPTPSTVTRCRLIGARKSLVGGKKILTSDMFKETWKEKQEVSFSSFSSWFSISPFKGVEWLASMSLCPINCLSCILFVCVCAPCELINFDVLFGSGLRELLCRASGGGASLATRLRPGRHFRSPSRSRQQWKPD